MVQPTFLFDVTKSVVDAQLNKKNFTINENSSELTINNFQDVELNDQYALGVLVAFGSGFAAALAYVLSSKAKEKGCPNEILAIAIGFCTLFVGTLGPCFELENRFFQRLESWIPSIDEISVTTDLILTTTASILSLLYNLTRVYASQIAPPTLVSTIGSCEILIALFVQQVVFGGLGHEQPDGKYQSTTWLILGSFMVLCSAIFMTFSNWMEKFLCPSKFLKEYKTVLPSEPNIHEATMDTENDTHSSIIKGKCLENHKEPLLIVEETRQKA